MMGKPEQGDKGIITNARGKGPPIIRNGHPRFYELTAMEEALHEAKNHDYAAGGSSTGNFERVSKILSLYPGLKHDDRAIVAIVYMLKQLDAYLWIKSNGHTPGVEGVGERLGDVSIYAKLIRIMEEGS